MATPHSALVEIDGPIPASGCAAGKHNVVFVAIFHLLRATVVASTRLRASRGPSMNSSVIRRWSFLWRRVTPAALVFVESPATRPTNVTFHSAAHDSPARAPLDRGPPRARRPTRRYRPAPARWRSCERQAIQPPPRCLGSIRLILLALIVTSWAVEFPEVDAS